ncbi:MAG: 1-acyl-sn-glycerol-3-phosphate acyltransferase [Gammaproteobacteria bacterium]|nr:1-acyl-sn-glycerol-3-phosphate acyltransferase [Gammaproteobacteria bacterium]
MKTEAVGFITRFGEILFGLWGWIVFSLCILSGLVVALIVPGKALRGWLLAGTTRAIFVLSGASVTVRGRENLPAGHCVVVANHASYLDGFLLKGYLPARFSFVIKGEMRKIPVVHFLLRRAGSKFVERFEAAGSSRDARNIVKAAKGGESLAFFAEGTFREFPGVGRFRPGAFVAAVRGSMPIVPVAIHGTRAMHPGQPKLPRPVPVRIDILSAIHPDDPAFENHRELAEKARQRILGVLDEPDLCQAGAAADSCTST